MKLNEVIELNGKEYTVELNRESVIRIEQYTNMQDAISKIAKVGYRDKSQMEISEEENPFEEIIDEQEIEKINNERVEALKKVYTKAFWIWLYPVEKLNIKQVEELLIPYFEDDSEDGKKANYITEKYKEFTEKSMEIRRKYLEEQKNLKALTK